MLGTGRFSTLSFCDYISLEIFFFLPLPAQLLLFAPCMLGKQIPAILSVTVFLPIFLKDNLFKSATCYFLKISDMLYNV